ncbi:kinesin-like protein KIN12B [Tripterygium wilfordii]|uniref:Kinesin-like protein KIN12B n=1 Tax=Tripterygium wilfordii TaxID=458696 RepID=A0A7J7E1V0_TRIWF|nr:kinesin-like protein KIN12B [Tripterygium wilfordii]
MSLRNTRILKRYDQLDEHNVIPKVIMRVRPPKDEEEGETIAKRISSDSLSINGQTFTFDSDIYNFLVLLVLQQDIFQLVGAPLVENCLAGFNSSVFAYGQTGSGKTYTMWGPTNALLEKNLGSDQQGLTPRVFQRLFARINEEQIKHGGKQLNYQCRCSFLEIYNEQITDLLDPSQQNLQIREDVKSGVYVENLTEEYVCTTKDVTQLLIKGLSNRRTGSTSINAESSRSHSVFTCAVESRCKSVADGISSLKTSRINLVDLAGSERQKLTGAAGERLKEAGNINRSLSQLGNLINILAEVSQTGKQRHIPYRDSRLTFLLQESLGGNAKLAMVCAISPAQSCKSETFSTLRFAQRAKAIKNKAIVNEVMQEDVKYLREVIRQLKEELNRMKENGNNHPTESKRGYSTEWARRSLNLLKLSLNRPMMLPCIDDDDDVEMEIDEEAVEKLCIQAHVQSDSKDHNTLLIDYDKPIRGSLCSYNTDDLVHQNVTGEGKENSVHLSVDILGGQCSGRSTEENKVMSFAEARLSKDEDESPTKIAGSVSSCQVSDPQSEISAGITENVVSDSHHDSVNCVSPPSLSVVPSDVSPVLKSPTLSISPRLSDSRKSLRTSWALTASQKDLKDDTILDPENLQLSSVKSLKGKPSVALSAQENKHFTPTDNLAASLHRGLEIIDNHQQSLVLKPSSFRFSFKPTETKPIFLVDKVNVGVQTLPEDDVQTKEDILVVLCSNCKSKTTLEEKGVNDSSDQQLVPVDGPESVGKFKNQVPKAVEKVLAGAIRREMALEEFCAKQTAEIVQLNRLVQLYKHERECNALIGQTREDKILRLESLMDGILPTEEFMEEELVSLTHEHKLLKDKYENHPEILRTKVELERAQNELERYRNFYELGEREVLSEEIQDLRNQLEFYINSSSSTRNRNSILHLTYSCGVTLAPSLGKIPESTNESAEGTLEQERIRWTEAESKWISLVEELRLDLEASRSLAEKQKQELETEKKCAEELQEAMRMAMRGHARMLEQYADLEEKHIQLLARHREMQEGIDDVKKAAARAGVRGAESRFINTLAAEISALKVDREKVRRYFRDENKALQAQLRDTAEAVQAAGELLVRLKEAEEAVNVAQTQALESKEETEKAYKKIEKLKRKHEHEISTLNGLLAESRLPKEATRPCNDSDMGTFDAQKPISTEDQQWKELEHVYNGEDGDFSKLTEPSSWFSGYDRCNI